MQICSRNWAPRGIASETAASEPWASSWLKVKLCIRWRETKQRLVMQSLVKLRVRWPTLVSDIFLTIIRHKKSIIMTGFWQSLRSLLHHDQSITNWHSVLTDGSSATLLRQQSKNVVELQSILQEFSTSGRETFVSVVKFLTTNFCLAETDNILCSYIRAVLEVFVLYSITTSDSTWMGNSRAAYIGRQSELILQITSSLNRISSHEDQFQWKTCLRLATQLELVSRREHCRAEIVKAIVELADTILIDMPFMMYDHDSHFHQLNATAFLKRLRPTAHNWIAIAYSLAVEHVVYEPPPRYTELINWKANRWSLWRSH